MISEGCRRLEYDRKCLVSTLWLSHCVSVESSRGRDEECNVNIAYWAALLDCGLIFFKGLRAVQEPVNNLLQYSIKVSESAPMKKERRWNPILLGIALDVNSFRGIETCTSFKGIIMTRKINFGLKWAGSIQLDMRLSLAQWFFVFQSQRKCVDVIVVRSYRDIGKIYFDYKYMFVSELSEN